MSRPRAWDWAARRLLREIQRDLRSGTPKRHISARRYMMGLRKRVARPEEPQHGDA